MTRSLSLLSLLLIRMHTRLLTHWKHLHYPQVSKYQTIYSQDHPERELLSPSRIPVLVMRNRCIPPVRYVILAQSLSLASAINISINFHVPPTRLTRQSSTTLRLTHSTRQSRTRVRITRNAKMTQRRQVLSRMSL